MSFDKFENLYPWINNDLFENILKKEYPTYKVTVENFHLKPAIKLGENFLSQMIRANVFYTKQYQMKSTEKCNINFIIKAQLMNNMLKDVVGELGIFEKEIIIYEHILPAVNKLLNKIGDNTKLAPK